MERAAGKPFQVVFFLLIAAYSTFGQQESQYQNRNTQQPRQYQNQNAHNSHFSEETRPPNRPFVSPTRNPSLVTDSILTESVVTRPTRYGGIVASSTTTTSTTTPRSNTQRPPPTPSIASNEVISFPGCGVRQTRPAALITNALPTYEGEFPWHAAIFTRFSNTKLPSYACGGSLISKRAVITASHCVTRENGVKRAEDDITVYLGKHYKNEGWNLDRGVQSLTPNRIILHPEYNKDNLTNDIAIIIFGRDVTFTNKVIPICLWNTDTDLKKLVGKYGTVAGWGLMDVKKNSGNSETNILQKATFPVHSFEVCVRSKPEFFTTILAKDNTFCAGYTNGTSACNGDSGGGMTFERDGRWYLRGVVSIGVPLESDQRLCNPKYYTIYSDVAKYLNWIARNVEGVTVIQPRSG